MPIAKSPLVKVGCSSYYLSFVCFQLVNPLEGHLSCCLDSTNPDTNVQQRNTTGHRTKQTRSVLVRRMEMMCFIRLYFNSALMLYATKDVKSWFQPWTIYCQTKFGSVILFSLFYLQLFESFSRTSSVFMCPITCSSPPVAYVLKLLHLSWILIVNDIWKGTNKKSRKP